MGEAPSTTDDGESHGVGAGATWRGWRVVDRAVSLAKGKGLGAAEALPVLAEAPHLALAREGVLGGVHLDVAWG